MNKLFGMLALLALTLTVPTKAHAIFELRASYGLFGSSPNMDQLSTAQTKGPSAFGLGGIGADAVVNLPLSSFGFGLRYEDLGVSVGANGYNFKGKSTRTAALLQYRFLDTFIHLGPVLTYGLSHSGYVEVGDNNGTTFRWEPGSVTSYSAGLNAEVSLIAILVGAEAGYQAMQFKDMSEKNGNIAGKQTIDLNGVYTKVFVGVGF